MAETTYREHMAGRATSLRAAAEKLMAELADEPTKELLTRRVIFQVDDVHHYLKRETTSSHEGDWLAFIELVLQNAEQQFRQLTELIAKFGGPKNVQTIG